MLNSALPNHKHHSNFSKQPKKRTFLSMASFSSSLEDHYHGGASASVSIPFDWESQPGTPKSKYLQNPTLPPLTPPPSYFYTKTKTPLRKKHSNSVIFHNIFPKVHSTSTRTSRNASPLASSPSLSSLSSSSASSTTYYSVPSSPITPSKSWERGRSMSSPKVLVDSRNIHCHDQYENYGSRVSTRTGCYLINFIKMFLREFH